MPTIDYDKLLALCDSAMPECPWQFLDQDALMRYAQATADYITALDPVTVRQLIGDARRVPELEARITQLRKDARETEREFQRATGNIAAEERWKAMQDHDYGSY